LFSLSHAPQFQNCLVTACGLRGIGCKPPERNDECSANFCAGVSRISALAYEEKMALSTTDLNPSVTHWGVAVFGIIVDR